MNGTFFWRALAASHSFDATAVRIVVELPEKPVLVGTIGIQEAGWRITPTPNGGVAEKNSVSRFESATVVARFAVESGTIARPVWQENFERGQFLAPAFVSGGGFILVVGLGVLVMVRVQAPGWSPEERIRVLKGLRVAGFVVILLGIFVAFITPRLLGHFGPAPNAIALSILVVGLLFVGTALVWRLRKRISVHVSLVALALPHGLDVFLRLFRRAPAFGLDDVCSARSTSAAMRSLSPHTKNSAPSSSQAQRSCACSRACGAGRRPSPPGRVRTPCRVAGIRPSHSRESCSS